MPNKTVLILLGNQLFPAEEIQQAKCDTIFMAEDLGLCTYEERKQLIFTCAETFISDHYR
ncbi:MAG: hypothetical protein QF872_07665 [Gammaproteobacteria bacterium]|jgi:hypothetical protein|nr:hypothetical protein [Gammaproteobacteria bacterium]